jgi:predicted O-methyltransferase YrrM
MIPIADEMMAQMTRSENHNAAMYGDDTAASVRQGEALLLYGLVRALRPKIIREIGGGYGFSTLHLATACRDNGLGKVYSSETNANRRAVAQEWLDRAGLTDWVEFKRDYSPFPHQIDLLFLDAVHTTAAVAGYIRALLNRLNDNVVIAIHDPNFDNHVALAVQVLGFDDWQALYFPETSVGGLAILRR